MSKISETTVDDHINSLRTLCVPSKDWESRFKKASTRLACMKLFGCDVSNFESMTNEEFAMAMISQNGTSVAFVPNETWENVKGEAKSVLTLQALAGTFPKKSDNHFSLVAHEGNELVGWQSLVFLIALGYDKVRIHFNEYHESDGYRDCSIDIWGVPCGKKKEVQISGELDFHLEDWLGKLGNVGECTLSIDLVNMNASCKGFIKVEREFHGNLSICGEDMGCAIEDVADRVKNAPIADFDISR